MSEDEIDVDHFDDDAGNRATLARLFALADECIEAGFDVLPAAVYAKSDGTLGKAPLLAHGHLDAHRDRQMIRQQLSSPSHVPSGLPAHFEVVVAFVPGSGGCGVLDCDVKHSKAGQESYEALVLAYGPFVTAAWRSPSGGANILFRKPKGAIYSNRSPWVGIDVRVDHGWVVAPGNTTPIGIWSWIVGGFGTASELPEPMTAELRPAEYHGRRATNSETVRFIEASPENSTLPVMHRFKTKLDEFRQAERGSRHEALVHIVGWAFGMNALDLRDAMVRIKEVWSELTAGEGREDEVDEVAAWTVGQERQLVAPVIGAYQPQARMWPRLDAHALIGIPGEVVRLFAPYSEADPVAVLIQFLAAFGNVVGLRPFTPADGARHRANLFAVLVGRTAKSRKGTSWLRVLSLMGGADPLWADRITSGLSSGEGLITAVGDEVLDKHGNVVSPAKDKRLLVVEEEFSRVLISGHREGNTLLAILRQAWDSRDLDSLTKVPLKAKAPHLSILGHITLEELRKNLTETEQFNGLANRFLFVLVTRSQVMSNGGDPDPVAFRSLSQRIQRNRQAASLLDQVKRSAEAEAYWDQLYNEMAEDDEEGMVGAAAARGEAHTLRLSLVYALACGSDVVQIEHVEAAWALWSYVRQSIDYVFGDKLGDEVADRLLQALRQVHPDGLDGVEQHRLFRGHASAIRLRQAIELLLRMGLVELRIEPTGGRPREVLVYRGAP